MKKSRFGSKKDPSLKRHIEALQRHRMRQGNVVDLEDFRQMRKVGAPKSILVVDDEEPVRNALKRILESEGYKVNLAEDAMGLSALLDHHHFDLILLDIQLPWVDGLELCQLLKSHPSFQKVPLILISGRKSREDIDLGFRAGCDDFLTKPFELDVLAKTVEKALALAAKEG